MTMKTLFSLTSSFLATFGLLASVAAVPGVYPEFYPIEGTIAAVNAKDEVVSLSTAADSVMKKVNGVETCEARYKIVPVTLKASNALRKVERGLGANQLQIGDVVSLGHKDFSLGFGKENPTVVSLNPVTLKLRQLPSVMSNPSFKVTGSMQSQRMMFGDVATIIMDDSELPLSATSVEHPARLTVDNLSGVNFVRFSRIKFSDLAPGQSVSLELTVHPKGIRKADSFDVVIDRTSK